MDEYKDKKISDIIKNIYSYKMNIKNSKFFEAWVCLKEISFYVDFENIENEAKKSEKWKNTQMFLIQKELNYITML